MKRRGFISIFALLLALLLFSVLTFILLSVNARSQINRHQIDRVQFNYYGESVINYIIEDPKLKVTFIEYLMEKKDKEEHIYIDPIAVPFNNVKINYKKNKENNVLDIYYALKKGENSYVFYGQFRLKTIENEDSKNDYIPKSEEELSSLLDKIKKEDYTVLQGDRVLFSHEERNYIITLEEYNLLKDYNTIESPEEISDPIETEEVEEKTLMELLIEKSTPIDTPLYFDGESLTIIGDESVKLEGVLVNRNNIDIDTEVILKGVLFNFEDNLKKSIEIQGKVLGLYSIDDIIENSSVSENYSFLYPLTHELEFLSFYIQ